MRYRYRSDDEFKIGEHSKIPKSWIQSKSQYYFDVFAGGTPSTNEPSYWDGSIPWINSGEVQNGLVKNISRYITDKGLKESSTKLIPEDTVLLAMTGATCGNVGYLTFESTANQSVMAFVPRKKFISKFLYYYLMCQKQQIEYYKTGGAQGGINVDNGKKLYINIPQIKEQEKIANFLDEKTSQFDLIISKKEKLIERLEEAKKSLISEVVTGKVKVVKTDDGYELIKRSSEEMKDSGVEWLGSIPKDWNVIKLKHLVSQKITDGPHETPELVDDGVPFLSAEAIVDSKISIPNMRGYITKEQYEIYAKKSKVYKNDILFCKSGSTTGKSALVTTDDVFGIWSPLAIIRANDKKIDYKNLFYVIQSSYFRVQVVNYWSFGTQPNIGMGTLENLYVPLSKNKEEQKSISEYLDYKIIFIDNLIDSIKLQIEKLKEAKQSLISEAVTGKIEILD